MSDQITVCDLHAPWRRVLLLVPVVLSLVGLWYVGRWCLGDTMAEWLPDVGAARAAARLAPADPQAHFTIARLAERSFEPEQLAAAVSEYEQAAALSPNDYRLWLELGRVRSLAGDDAGSERALRRATELAPNYPDAHWYLGNLLLRAGRDAEAFAELHRAAAENPEKYRPQVFEAAWRSAGGNVAAILAAMGDTPDMRVALIEFLIKRNAGDEPTRKRTFVEAVELWQSLDTATHQAHSATGAQLRAAFLAAKQYRAALGIERELGADVAPAEEQLLNGGFELPVGPAGKTWYDWQVTPPPAPTRINLDKSVRHSGARSLRLVFDAPDPLNFHHVAQTVVVTPQTRYRLTYSVRTEDLMSASTLVVEVADASDPARTLAASAPVAAGSNDWQEVSLEFTTGAQEEAIVVRLVRPPCPQSLCPLFGKIWYDDFNLQRVAGTSAANSGRGRDSAGARGVGERAR